jgi:hypothetical protein
MTTVKVPVVPDVNDPDSGPPACPEMDPVVATTEAVAPLKDKMRPVIPMYDVKIPPLKTEKPLKFMFELLTVKPLLNTAVALKVCTPVQVGTIACERGGAPSERK